MSNDLYTPTGNPAPGATGSSDPLRDEFDAIQAAFDAASRFHIQLAFADMSVPGSVYSVAPQDGKLLYTHVIAQANNDVNSLTVKLNGVAVDTIPASSTAAGQIVLSLADPDLHIAAGQLIEVSSNGAGSTVSPAIIVLTFAMTPTALTNAPYF